MGRSKDQDTGNWGLAGLIWRRLEMSAIRCKDPRKTVFYPKMSKPSGELSFEQALAELEKIVSRMESGEVSLEQALGTHKRGLELARFCHQRLEAGQPLSTLLEGG